MRLIDADELYKALAKPSDLPGDTIDVMAVRLAILTAPTVEAIPIEFLNKWFGNNYNAFTDLMMAWEKENG